MITLACAQSMDWPTAIALLGLFTGIFGVLGIAAWKALSWWT